MDEGHRQSAGRVRELLAARQVTPQSFREALLSVPVGWRDAWLDRVFDLDSEQGSVPDDGPELPRGCVPYWPSPVDALLRAVDAAGVQPTDTFVDVGSGVGRAATLVHLLTAAPVIGVEIQPQLVSASRELIGRLKIEQVVPIQGDAVRIAELAPAGSVYFLYCPFGRDRVEALLDGLEDIARVREIRLCCLDLPLPPRPWLLPATPITGDLAVYVSALHKQMNGVGG